MLSLTANSVCREVWNVLLKERDYNFYSGQILKEARHDVKMTQSELARKINSSKSYISRIEKGTIVPSVGTFYRIVNALGMRVEIVTC